MKYMETVVQNRMSDGLMNNFMVTYIERDIFRSITEDEIMFRFQEMKKRKILLDSLKKP